MNHSLKNDLLTPAEKVILNLTEGKFLDVSRLQTGSRYIGIVETLAEGQHGVLTDLSCTMPAFPIVSNNLQGYEEALKLAGLTPEQIAPYRETFLAQELEIEKEERAEATQLRSEGIQALQKIKKLHNVDID
jgi:hypothetical protein